MQARDSAAVIPKAQSVIKRADSEDQVSNISQQSKLIGTKVYDGSNEIPER